METVIEYLIDAEGHTNEVSYQDCHVTYETDTQEFVILDMENNVIEVLIEPEKILKVIMIV